MESKPESNLLDDLCTGSCLKFLPDFPGVVGWKESVFSQVALGHGVYRSRKVNTDPTVVVSVWNLAVSIARWLVGTEKPPNLAEQLVWHTQCWITGSEKWSLTFTYVSWHIHEHTYTPIHKRQKEDSRLTKMALFQCHHLHQRKTEAFERMEYQLHIKRKKVPCFRFAFLLLQVNGYRST